MKVLNSQPVYPWADNSFDNQDKVSSRKHTYWATYIIIWEPWNQG